MARVASLLESEGQVLKRLYGSLADDPSLQLFLQEISQVFGTHLAGFHLDDMRDGGTVCPLVVGGLDDASLREIRAEYERRSPAQNIWMQRSAPGFLRQGFEYGEAVVTDSELLASTYYRNYLRPAGIRHGMGVCLEATGGDRFSVLSLTRSVNMGAFGRDDFAKVRVLLPHMVTIFGLARRFARYDDQLRTLRDTVECLQLGVLQFDVEGHLLASNPAAAAMLASGRGLKRLADSRVGFTRDRAKMIFRSFLADTNTSANEVKSRSMLLTEPVDSDTMVLHLVALPVAAAGLFGSMRCILGILYPLRDSGQDALGVRILGSTLGLTPAEARLAMRLHRHDGLDAVAGSLVIAVSTARTHLKHIFGKTGLARQAEVVSLVERLMVASPR